MRVDFLKEALWYTRMGCAVFPVAAGDKVPAIKGGHGVKDATLSEERIQAWAAQGLDGANIGLACGEPSGNLVVIDIDPRNGGDRSLAGLALKGRAFASGPVAKTGNGGRHLFFRYDGKLGNSKGKLGDGIDIRSTGGYVVAPPSWLKPSDSGPGGLYEWVVSLENVPVPRLPIWVSELLRPREPRPYIAPKNFEEGASRLRHLAEFAARAPKGQRNSSAFWAACRAAEMAIDGKVSAAVVRERMMVAGQMAGLSKDEIEKTVESALKRISGERS